MKYIYHKNNNSVIVSKNSKVVINKSCLSVIKLLCKKALFDYDSRVKLTKRYCSINVKTPVYIDKYTLLIPTKSPKLYETIWINYYKVFNVMKEGTKTVIIFDDLEELNLEVPLHLIKKRLEHAKLVHDYIVSFNCLDTV